MIRNKLRKVLNIKRFIRFDNYVVRISLQEIRRLHSFEANEENGGYRVR